MCIELPKFIYIETCNIKLPLNYLIRFEIVQYHFFCLFQTKFTIQGLLIKT